MLSADQSNALTFEETAGDSTSTSMLSHDAIAILAYKLWEARMRDGGSGSPEEDWVEAEQRLASPKVRSQSA